MKHVSDECPCEGKKCTKCQIVRCAGEYTKDKRLKSGLKSQCRICSNAKNKDWRQNSTEYDSLRHKIWNEANAERAKEYRRKYRKANADQIKERGAKYRQSNAEGLRAKGLQYYRGNRDRINHLKRLRRQDEQVKAHEREKWREYYQNNRESMIARVNNWRRDNLRRHAIIAANRRSRKTLAGGSHTREEWLQLCQQYNFTCLCCGKQEPEIKLTADHIIPITKNGTSDISNIQPLCRSCNIRKGTKIIDFRTPDTIT